MAMFSIYRVSCNVVLCVVVFLFSNELIVVHHIVRTIICHASSRFILLLEMSKLESNADFH